VARLSRMKREDLSGVPKAVYGAVSRARDIFEVFPPVGVGICVGGIGMGCGFGWPMRAAQGPPKAFCGPGIGVALVGAGYGQGALGRRFGRDKRSDKARQNVARLETYLDNMWTNFLRAIQKRMGLRKVAAL
jgi:hypothetical protein